MPTTDLVNHLAASMHSNLYLCFIEWIFVLLLTTSDAFYERLFLKSSAPGWCDSSGNVFVKLDPRAAQLDCTSRIEPCTAKETRCTTLCFEAENLCKLPFPLNQDGLQCIWTKLREQCTPKCYFGDNNKYGPCGTVVTQPSNIPSTAAATASASATTSRTNPSSTTLRSPTSTEMTVTTPTSTESSSTSTAILFSSSTTTSTSQTTRKTGTSSKQTVHADSTKSSSAEQTSENTSFYPEWGDFIVAGFFFIAAVGLIYATFKIQRFKKMSSLVKHEAAAPNNAHTEPPIRVYRVSVQN